MNDRLLLKKRQLGELSSNGRVGLISPDRVEHRLRDVIGDNNYLMEEIIGPHGLIRLERFCFWDPEPQTTASPYAKQPAALLRHCVD